MKPVVSIAIALVVGITLGCGEEEIDARVQCDQEGFKAFSVGSASNVDGNASFEIANDDETPGRIADRQIRVQLGTSSTPQGDTEPLWLYLTDPSHPGEMYRDLSERTTDEPLTLQVTDASELPPGQEDITSVDHLDCSLDEGTICAQIGFDSASDGILGDDDEFVYNATGGDVTIVGYDTESATFSAHWHIETGPNVHRYQDESSGHTEGCIRPDYHTDDPDFWPLN